MQSAAPRHRCARTHRARLRARLPALDHAIRLVDVPVEPAVRRIRSVANRDDPRYRRTRAQICAATLRLLDDTDAARLTFAKVAAAAEVNRSTVHQHYDSRHELVADAVAGDLARIAEPLDHCRFDGRPPAPPELVQMFRAATDHREALTRLSDTDRGLLAARLTELLTGQLSRRFATERPTAFGAVAPQLHARYVAGGLVQLLLQSAGSLGPESPEELAEQAWRLIAPIERGTSREPVAVG